MYNAYGSKNYFPTCFPSKVEKPSMKMDVKTIPVSKAKEPKELVAMWKYVSQPKCLRKLNQQTCLLNLRAKMQLQ